jgi:hypothetical protein
MQSSAEFFTPTKSLDVSVVVETTTPIINTEQIKSTRKPRVNFHSIHDIVYGGCESQNDSGFSSFHKSPVLDIQNSTNEYEEDKENDLSFCKKNQIVHPTDANGKKLRTAFTDEQKRALEDYFNHNPYPDPKETEDLSMQLVLPENVIKVWFQNKRSRDKQRKFSKNRDQFLQKSENIFTSSPIVANLQLLQSRLNSYANMAKTANFQNQYYY